MIQDYAGLAKTVPQGRWSQEGSPLTMQKVHSVDLCLDAERLSVGSAPEDAAATRQERVTASNKTHFWLFAMVAFAGRSDRHFVM